MDQFRRRPIDSAILRDVPLFADLQPSDLRHLEESLRQVEVPTGAVLFTEGEPGDRFYVVITGEIEIIKSLGTTDERLLTLRKPGEFLGETSLFEHHGLRTASVRGRTAVRLIEMTHSDLDRLLHRRPELAYEVIRQLSLRLHQSAEDTIRDLREKNAQLAEAYEQLKAAQAQIIEKEKLERELQVARRIQLSMLPQALPSLAGFDFGACMLPARAVGGDLYDFIPLDEESVGILIGDVSGKGVPAALFMALVRSLARAEARNETSPAGVLCQLNQHLLEMNESGMFVTMVYGILNRTRKEFAYARAGHEIPLLYNAQASAVAVKMSSGMMVGIFPEMALDEQVIAIPTGGMLLLYTDGATDAENASGQRFGLENLRQAVQSGLGGPAQAVCDGVLEAIQAYRGETPQADDITLVGIHSA